MLAVITMVAALAAAFWAWRIALLVDYQNRLIIAAFRTDGDHMAFWNDEPKTVLDEFRNHMWSQKQQLERICGMLRYLQSYVWETQDTRSLSDIKDGVYSGYWDKTFRVPDQETFQLWTREQDLTEEFQREMRRSQSRSQGEPPEPQGPSSV